MAEVRRREQAAAPVASRTSPQPQATRPDERQSHVAGDRFQSSRSVQMESGLRTGATVVGAADGALAGASLLARVSNRLAPVVARTASVARLTTKAAPVLNLPVAVYDVLKARRAQQDPKATAEQKQSQKVMAGLSVTSAVTGVAALVFPPAAIPLAVISVGAGVGSIAADKWPAIRRWWGGDKR